MDAELRTARDERAATRSGAPTAGDPVKVIESAGDLAVVKDAAERVADASTAADAKAAPNVQLNLLAVGFMLAGTDILCLAAALVTGDWLLGSSVPIPLTMVLLASVLWIAIFRGFRLYSTHHLSAPDEFRRVISATSIGVLLLVVATMGAYTALSRSWIGLTWFLALAFELGARRIWRAALYRWRRRPTLKLRTLVVGDGEEAHRVREALAAEGQGFHPIGHVTIETGGVEGTRELLRIIRSQSVDCLFVASTEVTRGEMSAVRRAARLAGVDLRVSANVPETLSTRLSLQQIGDVMAISLRPVRLTGPQAAIKRTFDLVLGSVGLVLALPLIGVIAVAVKLSSPGPALFKQERVTSGGRAFTMYKFRTMMQDADRLLAEQDVDKSEAFFKLRVEPPVTKIGGVLRRFSLDELPQLWNVVKGDMSIVGPRPLPVEQVAANLELLEYRHEVRAGITGWWQINGRSDVDPQTAVQMDLFYIENWSPALDLYIILKTAGAAFVRGRGAY